MTETDFDSNGNPTVSQDAAGVVAGSLVYDETGNPIEFSAYGAAAANWTRDGPRECQNEFVDPRGGTSTFTYDSLGRLVSTTVEADGLVITESQVFDGLGRIVQETSPDGGVTSYDYDGVGNVIAITDMLGRRTEFRYDLLNRLTETILPDLTVEIDDNPRITLAYDAMGQVISETDELGNVTRYEYDSVGRQVAVILPDGTPQLDDNPRVRVEYDLAGQVVAEIDELGNRTEYEYDANGQNTLIRDALGQESLIFYDQLGRIVTMTDQLGRTTENNYDEAGRVTSVVLADNSEIRTVFNSKGIPTQAIDALGNIKRNEYNEHNQLVAVVDPLGGRTEYEYNQRGLLSKTIDALGRQTSYTYDVMNRPVSVTLPLGQSSFTTYDLAGNVETYTDFNGETISYTYDIRDRLVSETWEDGTVNQYTYLADGKLATFTDETGSTTRSYDERSRLTQVIDGNGRQLNYEYDAAGRKTAILSDDGTTRYAYDELHRVTTVVDSDGSETKYTYDAASQLTGIEFGNGLRESLVYNVRGELTSKVLTSASGEIINELNYTYDVAGNRLSLVESSGRTVSYTYDANYWLLSEEVSTTEGGNVLTEYTYDAVGNRNTKTNGQDVTTYTYDANDRLVSVLNADGTEVANDYDDNGRKISTSIDGELASSNTWDPRGRLVGVDENGDGIVDIEYMYNLLNVRMGEVVNGNEIQFLVDTNRATSVVLAEFDNNGKIAETTFGLGVISRTELSKVFFHKDGQGTIRLITDSSGNVVGAQEYDAFGVQLAQSGVITPYGYTGERTLPNGDVDLRARTYTPENGRFNSADIFPGNQFSPVTMNRYLYANSNPSSFTDPTGFFTLIDLSISQAIQNTLKKLKVPKQIKVLCRTKAIVDTFQTSLALTASAFAFTNSYINSLFAPDKFVVKLYVNKNARRSASVLKELALEATTNSLAVKVVNGLGNKTIVGAAIGDNGEVEFSVKTAGDLLKQKLISIDYCGVEFAKLETIISVEDKYSISIGQNAEVGGGFSTKIKDVLKLSVGASTGGGRFIGFEKSVEAAEFTIYYTPPFSLGAKLSLFFGLATWEGGHVP